ncbi:ArsA family ATPase [Wenjunlia tyrosinilytica]|uniref:Arsenite efflux ATP-binding protein ArsA n=1 Tax=Wenjunlia tyrosinilytica TaxID=1544741 RepID=A0A917ZFG0_9ACTN|nr:ArsA family ATPase [Wenjunlia tyrosinilytica]GGO81970.1 hypothetical protein GCM10012280_07510 [Wenjunlia tyrosinilytica]
MRTVLVTGSGGSGRTTAAAATAVHSARSGRRTLLVSADRGLGDVLDHPVTAVPSEVQQGLFALLTDSGARFRAEADRLQSGMASALDMFGVSPLDPEELTELPGSAEAALLRTLREKAESGEWDTVVVDCPPTSVAVATLALPEQLRRYLDRVLPAERQAARALRPLLATLAGVPMPAEWLFSTADSLARDLYAAQTVIEDNATTVRLVLEPGPLAAAELRRAHAALALFGHRLEAVLANRVLPTGSSDPWLADLSGQQQQELKALRTGHPVLELPHLGRDPVGTADLAAIGEHLAVPPREQGRAPDPWSVTERPEDGELGEFDWRLPLPGAVRADLDLVRRDDELMIDVGRFRRIVPLPPVLRRCTVTGATLREGSLLVRFAPDPAVWPTS